MNKSYRRGKKPQFNKSKNDKSDYVLDESILNTFQQYSSELDQKHDRYERIVKYSRDITIESKRIIFLLHTVDLRKETSQKILDDAKQRLMNLCTNNFILIAKELNGIDPYQFTRAYSAGLQEFIEAFSFYEHISGIPISDWEILQKHLTYEISSETSDEELNEKIDENTTDDMKEEKIGEKKDETGFDDVEQNKKKKTETKIIQCLIQPNEFMLGLADFSGEIMRRGINSLNQTNLQVCFDSSQLMQHLYCNYIGIHFNREFQRKISTLRQSLLKTENVCYNIKVRGGEAAKCCSSENTAEHNVEEDEGFYG